MRRRGDPIASQNPRQHVVVDEIEAVLLGESRQAIADERALRRTAATWGTARSRGLLGDGGQRQPIAQEN